MAVQDDAAAMVGLGQLYRDSGGGIGGATSHSAVQLETSGIR